MRTRSQLMMILPRAARMKGEGEDRLGHLDELSQGGRADGQAAVRHQSSVGRCQVIYCG